MINTTNKMKVEIWSDVTCPFCYIGKRVFEKALAVFEDAQNIEINWRSFELAPGMKTDPDKNIYQVLSEHAGMSLEQAKAASIQVADKAKQAGLIYDFDAMIPANSFNAHCFSHLAKNHGLQNKAEEILFKAYFTDGKNIDDIPTLIHLGTEIGLDPQEVKNALSESKYADEVHSDMQEAQQAGVKAAPFFVFDKKYTLSGAQDSSVFLATLLKSFTEWKKENHYSVPVISEEQGQFCEPGGECK